MLTELAKDSHKMGLGRRRSPRNPVKLVHDRDSVHTSKDTKSFGLRHNIVFIELPARSPDLDPLDYGVFGAVKREWQRKVSKERMSWERQCSLLIELLEGVDASVAIKAMPSRMQKCIAAEGAHFEQ